MKDRRRKRGQGVSQSLNGRTAAFVKKLKAKSPNPLRIDPTKSAALRRLFTLRVRRAFGLLKGRVLKLIGDEDALGLSQSTTNSNPNHGEGGRFASGPGGTSAKSPSSVLERLKALGLKAHHLEETLKQFVQDKISSATSKLPPKVRAVVEGSYHYAKAGTRVLFANFTAGQALAERVAKERGATPEQARRLRGILSAVDCKTFEVLKVAAISGVTAAHVPAFATALMPIASTSYLAYSTARNPLATYRAAKGLVRDALDKVSARMMKGATVFNAAVDVANYVASSVQAHAGDDWYLALLHAALEATGDLRSAVPLASRLYSDHPDDEATTEPSDLPDSEGDGSGVLDVPHTLNYDPNQPRDTDGRWAGAAHLSLPSKPTFLSKDHAAVAQNLKAVQQLRALAKEGDLKGLQAHPGTPSPKVQAHKKDLIKAVQAADQTAKAYSSAPVTLTPSPPAPAKVAGVSQATAAAVAALGSPEKVMKACQGGYSPADAQKAADRAKVVGAILHSGSAVPDAVHKVLDSQQAAAVDARVKQITTGNVDRARKEYSQTPLCDLNCLSKVEVKSSPVMGQAVCNMASRTLTMGSTSVTGDFRHELGHAIRSSWGGASFTSETAMTKAVHAEYDKVKARVAADPPKPGAKLTHDEYEVKYGLVGKRALDDWEELAAEHYRLYHREVYRDRNEGGGGKYLKQYRERHPGWAKIWDAHYTAALIGGGK